MSLLVVSIGGAIGAVSRYMIGLLMMRLVPDPNVPVAMMTVNVMGSFLLGLFLGAYAPEMASYPKGDPFLLMMGTGFCGAFTTYSTFSVEALQLLRSNQMKEALLYIAGSLMGSLLAFMIGFIVTG